MSHIERMKTEHKELKELKAKIDALNKFIYKQEDNIFDTLDKDEQVRMVRQLAFMNGYLGMLDSRLWVAHGNK